MPSEPNPSGTGRQGDGLTIQQWRHLLDAAPDGILIVDGWGHIVSVNLQIERMFGYPADELIGRDVELLLPDRLKDVHRTHRRHYQAVPRTCTMGAGLEARGRRRDGSELPIEINMAPVVSGDEPLIIGVVRDVSGPPRVRQPGNLSGHDQETLLRELHHRVTNSLQIVSSLLGVEERRIKDPDDRLVFEETRKRIQAMALIHQIVYRSNDASRVHLAEYARRLVEQIARTYGAQDSIRLEVKVDPVVVSFAVGFRLGLILNELVSNCLKHAFVGRDGGVVTVRLLQFDTGTLELTVADDGVGMPADVDVLRSTSLGHHLVAGIVSQLHGTLSVASRAGTAVTIRLAPPV